MKDVSYFRPIEMTNSNFSVQIFHRVYPEVGPILGMHWHEHIQLYWVTDGNGILYCNSASTPISKGDVLVINSNELHFLESHGTLAVYILTIDFTSLFSQQMDTCHTKYLLPISQNLILFKNYIGRDPEIASCIQCLISEYTDNRIASELAVKASTYHLIVLLLRNYVEKTINEKENDARLKNLKRLQEVFTYIRQNYRENIKLEQLSEKLHISNSHFCRLFKQISGKSLSDYINELRIEEAMVLLTESDLNITEIALSTGFSDSNYFSRVFKKYKKVSPSEIRNAL